MSVLIKQIFIFIEILYMSYRVFSMIILQSIVLPWSWCRTPTHYIDSVAIMHLQNNTYSNMSSRINAQ